jgi:hypothetical protein
MKRQNIHGSRLCSAGNVDLLTLSSALLLCHTMRQKNLAAKGINNNATGITKRIIALCQGQLSL